MFEKYLFIYALVDLLDQIRSDQVKTGQLDLAPLQTRLAENQELIIQGAEGSMCPTRNFDVQDFNILGKALQQNTTLIKLQLSICQYEIHNAGLAYLIKGLGNNTTIQELTFLDAGLDPEGVVHVANMLRINKTIRVLDLRNNFNVGTGLAHLAEAAQNHPSLETLYLSYTKDDAIKALLMGLGRNSSLLTLVIARGLMGPQGAQALAAYIAENKTLKTLDISGSPIGDEGALSLAKALEHNTTLTTLNVAQCTMWSNENPVTETGLMAISAALAKNKPPLAITPAFGQSQKSTEAQVIEPASGAQLRKDR